MCVCVSSDAIDVFSCACVCVQGGAHLGGDSHSMVAAARGETVGAKDLSSDRVAAVGDKDAGKDAGNVSLCVQGGAHLGGDWQPRRSGRVAAAASDGDNKDGGKDGVKGGVKGGVKLVSGGILRALPLAS